MAHYQPVSVLVIYCSDYPITGLDGNAGGDEARYPLLVDALDLMAAGDAIDVAMPQVQGEDWDKRLCAALDLHLSPRTSPPGAIIRHCG